MNRYKWQAKVIELACIIIFTTSFSYAQQKPAIDANAIKNWPELSFPTFLSDDGKFFAYTIDRQPRGHKKLIIQSTENQWRSEFIDVRLNPQLFTFDSKYAILKSSKDSLLILTLGTTKVDRISNVSIFTLNENFNAQYVAYKKLTSNSNLWLRNLCDSKERVIPRVAYFKFCDEGKSLVYQQINSLGKSDNVFWWDLATDKHRKIWSGAGIENIVLSNDGRQLAFKSNEKDKQCILWFYKKGMLQAKRINDDKSLQQTSKYEVQEIDKFSPDGKRLFILTTTLRKVPKESLAKIKLKIWKYTDELLQSQELNESASQKYLSVINLFNNKFRRVCIQGHNESIVGIAGEYALIEKRAGKSGLDQINWNKASQHSFYLRALTDGTSKMIINEPAIFTIKLSPNGNYVVYFDPKKRNFCSYESSNGTIRNLTESVKNVNWNGIYDRPDSSGYTYEIAGWLKDNTSVLLNDRNDLWQISLGNKYAPINLSNGYGQKHYLFLEPIDNDRTKFKDNEFIICSAFNRETKFNGFYKLQLGKQTDPELLTMGEFFYYANQGLTAYYGAGVKPIKAINGKNYIVGRCTAKDSYNYYNTTDFKKFSKLTDLAPEKEYNWLTAERHKWQSLDGKKLQGILYKPENFDPNKNYPLILNFYEKRSDDLYNYIKPEELTNGMFINIPYYTSDGYLVFTPDINYSVGDPMQGTYDAIISSVNYISKMSFVNTKKIGLQSGSFGGFQTNYIVTHSNVFTAACSAAGISDLISYYGGVGEVGEDYKGFIESGQIRMVGSLWEKTDLYIKNSPIFHANKVTTPLLMMHTSIDGAVPFSQSFEMFTALRRLGKKVWLLEYGDGDHGVSDSSAIDFSIRMKQYFDFYLKDKPAPMWMLDGLPANPKGIETRLGLDSTGRRPGPGLVTEEEQKRIEAYSKIPLSEKLQRLN